MKRGRKKTGEPGTDHYKVPGTQAKEVRKEIHVQIAEDDLNYIQGVTDNTAEFVRQAIKEAIKRELAERVQNEINRANQQAQIYD